MLGGSYYLQRFIERVIARRGGVLVLLQAPLTSTLWDGDAYSTTAKTLVDLSAVFGVPAGARGILCNVAIQDSDAANTDCWLILGPNSTAGLGSWMSCLPANDRYARGMLAVICDANGDIYYQVQASGASTMDVWIQIYGYYI